MYRTNKHVDNMQRRITYQAQTQITIRYIEKKKRRKILPYLATATILATTIYVLLRY